MINEFIEDLKINSIYNVVSIKDYTPNNENSKYFEYLNKRMGGSELTILFLEGEDIKGFINIILMKDKNIYLNYIESAVWQKGIGTNIVASIKAADYKIHGNCYSEISIKFWKKVGAVITQNGFVM